MDEQLLHLGPVTAILLRGKCQLNSAYDGIPIPHDKKGTRLRVNVSQNLPPISLSVFQGQRGQEPY